MIDLHLHSTFSDGTETPESLVELAAAAGLTALSLTDHDTLQGTARFAAAACRHGIRTIPGVELSVQRTGGELHLLGFGMDSAHADLQNALSEIREDRQQRNRGILEKLRALGYPLDEKAVLALAGNPAVVGRPHIAKALVEAGSVRDKTEAFSRFLAYGMPAYCDRLRLEPARAIALIHAAGGRAVLAHPGLLELKPGVLRKLVKRLRNDGLDGLEAYYPGQPASTTAALLQIARDEGLLVTGGSDFHGPQTPYFRIGVGSGGLRVPDECFEKLMTRCGSTEPEDGTRPG